MTPIERLSRADRLVMKGLADFDAIMAAHWIEQAEKLRAAGVPEDQIEAGQERHDELHKENRVTLAKELWINSLAFLSVGDRA